MARFRRGAVIVEWRIKLEARSGWGEVETIEVASFRRRVVGLTAEEIDLSLEEAKRVLAELQRPMLQTPRWRSTHSVPASARRVSKCVASAIAVRGPSRHCSER
jgi:hypothetical protein